jgi:hypothetical protein
MEPLVEVLIDIGITSPEAESLLRGIFVHRARQLLTQQQTHVSGPSDVRISLMTGVHRNFVRQILSEPPKIPDARENKRNRANRLLRAWHTDPAYLDSSGKPRDLPEKGGKPSFQSLAATYVPGAAAGLVLDRLRRAGFVQAIAEHRVRVRSRTVRPHGFSADSILEVGNRAREFLDTLSHNLRRGDTRRYCESIRTIEVDKERIAIVRDLVSRRSTTFLTGIENELVAEAENARRLKKSQRIRVGLTVYMSEDELGTDNRR